MTDRGIIRQRLSEGCHIATYITSFESLEIMHATVGILKTGLRGRWVSAQRKNKGENRDNGGDNDPKDVIRRFPS
jgi:hypothetical protein